MIVVEVKFHGGWALMSGRNLPMWRARKIGMAHICQISIDLAEISLRHPLWGSYTTTVVDVNRQLVAGQYNLEICQGGRL